MMDSYLTLKKETSAEMTEKRSRFIGYIKPVKTQDDALAFLNAIRQKHWDATHNVYAYIIRGEGVTRYSDDGEPQGTAGIPVLDVLKKRGLTDCIVVVTRYFGGVLLGAGGLVRAYSSCASLAVDAAGEVKMERCAVCALSCSYTLYGKMPSLITDFSGAVESSDFTDAVNLRFRIPQDAFERFNAELSELSLGKCRAEKVGEDYFEMTAESKS